MNKLRDIIQVKAFIYKDKNIITIYFFTEFSLLPSPYTLPPYNPTTYSLFKYLIHVLIFLAFLKQH